MNGTKKITRQLSAAAEQRLYVRLRRPGKGWDLLDGFVVAVNRTWVLLWNVDEGSPNGWTVVPTRDIAKLQRAGSRRFIKASLKLQHHWPPPMAPFPIDRSDWQTLIEAAAASFPLVTFRTEYKNPDVCYIGRPVTWSRKILTWHDVTPSARWALTTREFRIGDISRLDLGQIYESNLNAVAGPPPGSEEFGKSEYRHGI